MHQRLSPHGAASSRGGAAGGRAGYPGRPDAREPDVQPGVSGWPPGPGGLRHSSYGHGGSGGSSSQGFWHHEMDDSGECNNLSNLAMLALWTEKQREENKNSDDG